MQTIGTELFRHALPKALPQLQNFSAVDLLLSKLDPTKNYVIDDVRFVDELRALQPLNSCIVRIHRPASATSTDTHASEAELPSHLIDFEYLNSSTLEQFESVIKQLTLT